MAVTGVYVSCGSVTVFRTWREGDAREYEFEREMASRQVAALSEVESSRRSVYVFGPMPTREDAIHKLLEEYKESSK